MGVNFAREHVSMPRLSVLTVDKFIVHENFRAMKKHLLLLSFSVFTFSLFAQELVGVSVGSGYSEQAYYRLFVDATDNIDNTAWDIAFTTISDDDAGIHVNESSKTEFSPPTQPSVELYAAPTDVFGDAIDPSDLTDRLFNDEISWNYGAANSERDENNPDDYGWGLFDSGTDAITGTKVFAIKLRSATWKKFQIISMAGSIYTMKYANLDGSNEVMTTIDKADFPNASLVYFSFETEDLFEVMPWDWDLAFQRYVTSLDDGNGSFIDLPVTGVLSGYGVQVAEADEVDPEDVDFVDWEDSLKIDMDIIGHDWKIFNNGWTLQDDLAYFVKTATGHLWKIIFLDFSGSSSGNIVFEKTDLGGTSAVNDPNSNIAGLDVFPNPVRSEASVVFTLKKAVNDIRISIHNVLGQEVWSGMPTVAHEGLNALTINKLNIQSGAYFLSIEVDNEMITQRIWVQ